MVPLMNTCTKGETDTRNSNAGGREGGGTVLSRSASLKPSYEEVRDFGSNSTCDCNDQPASLAGTKILVTS